MSPDIAGLPPVPGWRPQAVSVPDDQADYIAWPGAMEGKNSGGFYRSIRLNDRAYRYFARPFCAAASSTHQQSI